MLPTAKPPGLREDSAFSGCLTLEGLGSKIESEEVGIESVPPFTVLRCALASGKLDKQPTTEGLFKSIEDHLPRLNLSSNLGRQVGPRCFYDHRLSSVAFAIVGKTMGNSKCPPPILQTLVGGPDHLVIRSA